MIDMMRQPNYPKFKKYPSYTFILSKELNVDTFRGIKGNAEKNNQYRYGSETTFR